MLFTDNGPATILTAVEEKKWLWKEENPCVCV